jgi:hypothetical protein
VAVGASDLEIVRERVSIEHLTALAVGGFGDLVKAVVDVRLGIMSVGGELHADGEAALLDAGAVQADLWGINLYPAEYGASGWLEFDSMINVRPRQGNRSRSVEDSAVRHQIVAIVERLVR